jgi:hypothetical protein
MPLISSYVSEAFETNDYTICEVSTAMKIQVIFWIVMPCSDVVGYCFQIHPEGGGSTVLRNVGILPHQYMASQPRRPRLETHD